MLTFAILVAETHFSVHLQCCIVSICYVLRNQLTLGIMIASVILAQCALKIGFGIKGKAGEPKCSFCESKTRPVYFLLAELTSSPLVYKAHSRPEFRHAFCQPAKF